MACASSNLQAGTIRADRTDQQYRNLAAQAQFASVGRYSAGSLSGSFTLISPNWAITAAHVVDTNADGSVADENITNDSITLGSITRGITQLIVPVGVNGNAGWNGDLNHGFDIALARLSSPITTITPTPIYTGFQELGKTITTVGYGQTGTGLTGAQGPGGTKRAGNNTLDRYQTFSNGATALRADFDEPSPRVSPNQSGSTTPLDLEYMIAPGDSGGGSFLLEKNVWYLAGVTSGLYDSFNYPNTTTDGSTYGDEMLLTRVAAYQQFIYDHIPELAGAITVPEPAGLLGVVFISGLLRRRRTNRHEWNE